jgi:hypothetical protein
MLRSFLNPQGLIFMIAALLLVSAGVVIVRRIFWRHFSDDAESLTAVSAAILSVYGLLLGLTLAAAWDRYQRSEEALITEANGLFSVSRLALSFPEGGRAVQQAVLDYGNTVIANELLDMDPQATNRHLASEAMENIYRAMVAVGASPDGQLAVTDPIWVAISNLDHARGERLMLSREGLPDPFWTVLLFGATLSILSLLFVVPRSARLHFAIALGASGMIVLMLLLLTDLDHPFEHPGTVDFETYRAAVHNLEASMERDWQPVAAIAPAATPAP